MTGKKTKPILFPHRANNVLKLKVKCGHTRFRTRANEFFKVSRLLRIPIKPLSSTATVIVFETH